MGPKEGSWVPSLRRRAHKYSSDVADHSKGRRVPGLILQLLTSPNTLRGGGGKLAGTFAYTQPTPQNLSFILSLLGPNLLLQTLSSSQCVCVCVERCVGGGVSTAWQQLKISSSQPREKWRVGLSCQSRYALLLRLVLPGFMTLVWVLVDLQ